MENTVDNIKALWGELKNDGSKTRFIEACADELNKSPNTLHNHWFARFWQIPEKHQGRIVELLQNTIKLQNQTV